MLGGATTSIDTVSGALSTVPSLPMSCATYVPGRSAVNDGVAMLALSRVARLPAGAAMSAQSYVNGSVSGSLDAVPSIVTVVPATMPVWSAPARATGGELSVLMVIVLG